MLKMESMTVEMDPLWDIRKDLRSNTRYPHLEGVVQSLPHLTMNCRYENIITGESCVLRPQLPLGGLLADDMGLGKTLTTLALIAVSKPAPPEVSRAVRQSSPTLVVTPVSSMIRYISACRTSNL